MIPGGTQLLSKRPEQFLPDLWPAYYSKAKGCKVWDLDGVEYTDTSYMGIGANVLGYAIEQVDDAVKSAIDSSCMCTLNAPEEVFLAERLLKLHEWAEMVRYAKTGGEAMAIAVRIARAHTNKDIVLFCGYHGWHDWYLSANLKNENSLNDQLLSGLEPLGVPKGLTESTIAFHYNDIDEFRIVYQQYKGRIAAVVMEPIRNDYPEEGFLEEIRKVTVDNNIVLIFDEITAGFRLCNGGSHLTLGIYPDIAVFGKALANGYPMSAIIGKRDIMQSAQQTFISSTFWTERVGLVGAIATIDFYENNRVYEHLLKIGEKVQKGWQSLANKYSLDIQIGGIMPLSHFSFNYQNSLGYKTFFTAEMLKHGYLATTAFYVSYSHTERIISDYLAAVDNVFCGIADIIDKKIDISKCLEGPICHSGFSRLN